MIDVKQNDNLITVKCLCEGIALNNAPDIEKEIKRNDFFKKAYSNLIIFDMEIVETMDSCAIGLLIQLKKLCNEANNSFLIKNMNDRCSNILKLTKTYSLFDFVN